MPESEILDAKPWGSPITRMEWDVDGVWARVTFGWGDGNRLDFFCPRSYSTRCRKPVCFWVYFVRHFDKFTCVVVFYSNEMQSTVSHVLFWFWHRCVSFSHLYFVSRILLVNALAIKPPIRLSRGNSVSWSMNVGTRSPDLTFSSLFQIHAHIRFGQHFHGS